MVFGGLEVCHEFFEPFFFLFDQGFLFFFLAEVRKKHITDTFDIILEISSTILSMHKFFLTASQIHEKFGCKKSAPCKLGSFLAGLNEFLFEEKTYDEIHALFTKYCVEHHDVFYITYKLICPCNAEKLDKLSDLLINIDDLQQKE